MLTYTVNLLACPACGATLNVPANVERLSCSYCHASLSVERREHDAVSLSLLERLTSGMDRTAAELAIPRLTKELAEARRRLHAANRLEQRRARLVAEAKRPRLSMRHGAYAVAVIGGIGGLWATGDVAGALATFVAVSLLTAFAVWLDRRPSIDVQPSRVALGKRPSADEIRIEVEKLETKLRAARAVVDA